MRPYVQIGLTFDKVDNHPRLPCKGHLNAKSGSRGTAFTILTSTCFWTKERALFRHVNFETRSDSKKLCAFCLRHLLRATTACTLLTSQLTRLVRAWCAFLLSDFLSCSLLLSDSSNLCVASVHAIGSSTSKLPSNKAKWHSSMFQK